VEFTYVVHIAKTTKVNILARDIEFSCGVG